ncbi:hypothetical protein GGF32_006140 [Allomyces javanicus]|nr:hypothetical protein GGF32_006140 [Allomyces javanicus]
MASPSPNAPGTAPAYVEIYHANLTRVLSTTPPWSNPASSRNDTSNDARLWVFATCFNAADCTAAALSTVQFAEDPCVAPLVTFSSVDTTFTNEKYDAAQRAFNDQLATVMDQCPGPWTQWSARVCVPLLHPTLLVHNVTLPALPPASLNKTNHVAAFRQYQEALAANATALTSSFGICTTAAPLGSLCTHSTTDPYASMGAARQASIVQVDAFYSPNRDAMNAPSPNLAVDAFLASDKSHPTPQFLADLNTTLFPRAWDDDTFPTQLIIKTENYVAVTACSSANVTVPVLVNGAGCDPQLRPCMFHKCTSVGGECSSSGDLFVSGLLTLQGLKFQSTGTKIKQASLQIALSMVILYLIYRYRKKFMAKFNAWHIWYRDGSPMFDPPTDEEAELPAYDDANAVQPPPLPNLTTADSGDAGAAVAVPSMSATPTTPASALASPAPTAAIPSTAASYRRRTNSTIARSSLVNLDRQIPSFRSQFGVLEPGLASSISSLDSRDHHIDRRVSDSSTTTSLDLPTPPPDYGDIVPPDPDRRASAPSVAAASAATTSDHLELRHPKLTAVFPPTPPSWNGAPNPALWIYSTCFSNADCAASALPTAAFMQDDCVDVYASYSGRDKIFDNATYDDAQRTLNRQFTHVMAQCMKAFTQWTAQTCVSLLHPALLKHNITIPRLPPRTAGNRDHEAAFNLYQSVLAQVATIPPNTASLGICTVAAPYGSPCQPITQGYAYAANGQAAGADTYQASSPQWAAERSPNRDAINAPSPYLPLDPFFRDDKMRATPQFIPALQTTLIPRAWDADKFPIQLLGNVENFVAVTACSPANVTVPVMVDGTGCNPATRPCMFHKCPAPGGECSARDLFVSGLAPTLQGLTFYSTGTIVRQAAFIVVPTVIVLVLAWIYRRQIVDKFDEVRIRYTSNAMLDSVIDNNEVELPGYSSDHERDVPPLYPLSNDNGGHVHVQVDPPDAAASSTDAADSAAPGVRAVASPVPGPAPTAAHDLAVTSTPTTGATTTLPATTSANMRAISATAAAVPAELSSPSAAARDSHDAAAPPTAASTSPVGTPPSAAVLPPQPLSVAASSSATPARTEASPPPITAAAPLPPPAPTAAAPDARRVSAIAANDDLQRSPVLGARDSRRIPSFRSQFGALEPGLASPISEVAMSTANPRGGDVMIANPDGSEAPAVADAELVTATRSGTLNQARVYDLMREGRGLYLRRPQAPGPTRSPQPAIGIHHR